MIVKLIVGILFASGMIALFWALLGRLLQPVGADIDGGVHALICVKGSSPALQRTTDGLTWLINSGKVNMDILIADAGMDEETRRTAELIAGGNGRVKLCGVEELGRIWTTQEEAKK